MKVLVVVPVYNAEPIIHQVIEELLSRTKLPLLVVDDGSEPQLIIQDNERIHCVRLPINQGKGMALQKALAWAKNHHFTHLLSFDGDGQHQAGDVKSLVEACRSHPKAFVIGARRFDESVPGVSRFGRRFSNFWVSYQTGVKVSDSQSGLRVYPVDELSDIPFFTRRYDFEIEVLVRGIWRGMAVVDVDVGVTYARKEERISHFNKLWDNVRITFLNIILIAYALIFYQRSRFKIVFAGVLAFICYVVAFTMGVFWALFFGILTCVLFKINVIVFVVAFATLLLV